MSLDFHNERRIAGVIKAVLVLSLGVFLLGAAALPALAAPPGAAVNIYKQMVVPPAPVRTLAEMAPLAPALAGKAPAFVKVPFRPTVPAAVYQAHKAEASARAAAVTTGAVAGRAPLAPIPDPTAPKLKSINFAGVNSVTAGNFLPPDTHGAVGSKHYIQITNSHLDIYNKSNRARVKSVTLATFFSYVQEILFDPRVIFDASVPPGRWIITADSFPEDKSGQLHHLAVSLTDDPKGAYNFYHITVADTEFWDYPQLGVDQNAIVMTANMFDSAEPDGNGPFGASTFQNNKILVVPKAQAYAGQALTLTFFEVPEGNVAPPIVLDDNPITFLVAPPFPGPTSSVVTMRTLTYPADFPVGDPVLSDPPVSIPVAEYRLPPPAVQGTNFNVWLDTLDCRFVNASTQVNNSLFQVHTINDGSGFARPRYYEFDISDPLVPVVFDFGSFSRSLTSYDFNASIAANPSGDVFVTWSATDPTKRVNAEVRFSGRKGTNVNSGIASPGVRMGASSIYYNPSGPPPPPDPGQLPNTITERWGDYSAVSLDPADNTKAWIVNEWIMSKIKWGSRIGRIGY